MRAGAFILLAALCGCAQQQVPAKERGEQLFHDPALSTSQFNTTSCATCHTTAEQSDSPRIAGTLHDSAFRESYWGGYEPRFIDAVNFCLVSFMRGEELSPSDPKGRALYEYLASISPDRDSPAQPVTFVENVVELPRGDADRGHAVYDRACRTCHGEPHTGAGRPSTLASVVPEASNEFAGQFNVSPSLVVIEKVRHGQFFGVGGTMPPFSREALSDEQLADIIAFLAL